MAVFISGSVIPPLVLDDTFSANSWDDIVKACQMNIVPKSWVIGDSKMMTIGGVDYQIDIIGKNHDTYSDGTGTAPLTFQMHECFNTKYEMNISSHNDGGWLESDMRLNDIPTVFNLMPSEVRKGIRHVNKMSSTGHQRSTINTAQDTLFLLSQVEILGTIPQSKTGEGTQYAYYANGGSTVKKVSGSAAIWWTRSPSASSNTNFCTVSATGQYSNTSATDDLGISPAFCF